MKNLITDHRGYLITTLCFQLLFINGVMATKLTTIWHKRMSGIIIGPGHIKT